MQDNRPESQTRRDLIDRQMAQAGWSTLCGNLRVEVFLTTTGGPTDADARDDSSAEVADYVLLGPDRKPIAVLEAKRTSRDQLAGQRQASEYADRIRAKYGVEPFIFLSNGLSHWLWERDVYPPRQIAGFYTPEDLERLDILRKYRQPLDGSNVNPGIADRGYQAEAVKRVAESISSGQRKSLLVMATGTGKTRTAIALVDLLLRGSYAERVLFLVDRRELAKQAMADFKLYLPNQTRTRIEGGTVDRAARIHIATYPSMMQVYRNLSPGFYDLVIADESHRSIYNRYKVLLEYFDALQLGLTATPTDYIDHNTFTLFDSADGRPTFYYSYEQAIADGYLADYRVLEAQTSFQLEGIKAGQLPPELQRQLEQQGIDLSEIDFDGTEIERRVTNRGTNDAIVREFMTSCRKDATGTRPAKSIIFSISHRHAVELFNSFNRLYPNLQKGIVSLAEVIDSHMERAEKALDDFKTHDMPRVAISVDMLDSGVDVPATENLVLAKPVFSQVKFWQMIGRGTRLHTDPATGRKKQDFLVIDHWNNFAYFNLNPQGEISKPTEPLPVTLFKIRLQKLRHLREAANAPATAAAISQLQRMLAQLPMDNPNVRARTTDLLALADRATWDQRDTSQADQMATDAAPLLRLMPDVNFLVMTFEVRTERLAAAFLTADSTAIETLRSQIIEDLQLLPTNLPEIHLQEEKLRWVMSDGFWDFLDYNRIMDLQITFAPLMRHRQRAAQQIIALDLPDEIARRQWIIYGPSGEGAFAETYREQVEALVRDLADQLPALDRLKRGLPMTESDLEEIDDTLNRPDLFITREVLRQVYERPDAGLLDLLKHILRLGLLPSREEEIRRTFDAFLATRSFYTATQILFLRTVRSAVLERARLTPADLERPPFSRVGAASSIFSGEELAEILTLANSLVA